MSPKTKARIKCLLIMAIVIVVVACFVGLVIGLSLGLAPHDCNYSYLTKCSYNGDCYDLQTSQNNCGTCNNSCPVFASCQAGQCALCHVNCSKINACSVSPCNNVTGCSVLDCNNDGNACTIPPCNTTTGCSFVDCLNDNNVCTKGTCNSVTGCPTIDCNNDGDVCTEPPCNPFTGCAYVCPTLYLNGTAANFNATYHTSSPSQVAIVSSTLQLYSSPNIFNVSVTPSSFSAAWGAVITTTSSIPGRITANYDTTTGIFTLTGDTSAPQYQPVLAGLVYSASFSTPRTISFSFQVYNDKPTSLPQEAVATIHFT